MLLVAVWAKWLLLRETKVHACNAGSAQLPIVKTSGSFGTMNQGLFLIACKFQPPPQPWSRIHHRTAFSMWFYIIIYPVQQRPHRCREEEIKSSPTLKAEKKSK
jgi:hypothetical protein